VAPSGAIIAPAGAPSAMTAPETQSVQPAEAPANQATTPAVKTQ
jgi:hypothetical protein